MLVRGKRGVRPEAAWLPARALGTTPEFWVHLQVQHDLARTKPARGIRRLNRSASPALEMGWAVDREREAGVSSGFAVLQFFPIEGGLRGRRVRHRALIDFRKT